MRVSGFLGRVASAVLLAVSGCTRRESDNKRQAVLFPFPNSNTVCSFPILYKILLYLHIVYLVTLSTSATDHRTQLPASRAHDLAQLQHTT